MGKLQRLLRGGFDLQQQCAAGNTLQLRINFAIIMGMYIIFKEILIKWPCFLAAEFGSEFMELNSVSVGEC